VVAHIHPAAQLELLVKEMLAVETSVQMVQAAVVEQVEQERITLELLAVPVELAQLILILLLQLALVLVVNTLVVVVAVHTVVEVLELLTVAVVREAKLEMQQVEQQTQAAVVADHGQLSEPLTAALVAQV
jgi:hypothetical protein